MNAANMNQATAQAFEGMMQQKQARPSLSLRTLVLEEPYADAQTNTHTRSHARPQMKDFMSLYSNLVERCFLSCCQDFTSKALSSKEVSPRPPAVRLLDRTLTLHRGQESCVMNCADKFLKHSERSVTPSPAHTGPASVALSLTPSLARTASVSGSASRCV